MQTTYDSRKLVKQERKSKNYENTANDCGHISWKLCKILI